MAGEFDYLIVGSDSGKITILRFDPTANNNFGAWIKVQEETFGKTGCRRIVPGQYLAADPCGRAVMISAVEKQKFVYVLNRNVLYQMIISRCLGDSASNLIISSPLEAHKSKTIVFATCGVDNAYDNPLFACIEVNYEPYDDPSEDVSMDRVQRSLTFYELDLGLNHVTRKFTEEAPASANAIIAVPNKDSSGSGPGGVLVCCEDMLYYRRMDHPPVSVKFPRSSFLSDSDTVLIQSHTLVRNKKDFFFLLQTDHGDVFQVCVEYNDLSVSEIRVSYFDTLPTSIALVFLRPNFLVCASEFGNHFLFQIENMDGQPSEYSSSRYDRIVSYTPRKLANMVGTDEIASMSPTLDMKVADLTKEGIPQFYALCGRSSASCLRIVRHGLPVAEMAVSEMHGSPSAIWSVKRRRSDENDAYIVVSYSNATLVLSIGETVEEVSNSGFESGTPTLGVGLLGEDTLVQVFPQGIKFISVDGRQNLWRPRTSKTIAKCAINSKQILISLNGGEVVYFEHESGLIVNELDRVVVEGGSEIACLAVSDVPQNQVRGKYVVIGSIDNRVRLFSTDNPSSPLSSPLSIQGLTATPSSAVIASISESGAAEGAFARTFLYIGLKNGILIRSRLDESTGEISDTRKM
jgi:splicing factor 3B subunit 3